MQLASSVVEVPASSHRRLTLRMTRAEFDAMKAEVARMVNYDPGEVQYVNFGFQRIGQIQAEVVVEDA